MKQYLLYISFLIIFSSCSSYHFMKKGMWLVDQKYSTVKELSHQMIFNLDTLNFLSTDTLNIITRKKDFHKYPGSRHLVRSVLKQIPLKADSLLFIVPGKLIVFENIVDKWDPDCDIISPGRNRKYIGSVHNSLVDRKTGQAFYADRMMVRNKWTCIVYLNTMEEVGKEISRGIYRNNLYFPEEEP